MSLGKVHRKGFAQNERRAREFAPITPKSSLTSTMLSRFLPFWGEGGSGHLGMFMQSSKCLTSCLTSSMSARLEFPVKFCTVWNLTYNRSSARNTLKERKEAALSIPAALPGATAETRASPLPPGFDVGRRPDFLSTLRFRLELSLSQRGDPRTLQSSGSSPARYEIEACGRNDS